MAADEDGTAEFDTTVSLVVQDDELLVAGEPVAVDRYVERLRRSSQSLGAPEVTLQKLTDAGSFGAGLTALRAASGTVFRLTPEHQKLLDQGHHLMESSGRLKGVLVGPNNKVSAFANLEQVSLAPEQALAIQGMMTAVALRAAIQEVQKAVERVEGKVNDLVDLTRAHQIAGVIGNQDLLTEYVNRMERTGTLPRVDWDTVAGLGPELVKGIEEIRQYVRRRIGTLDPKEGAKKRSDLLREMTDQARLGEVLQLLVVAEHSHYLWQRLRIERSRTSDPEQVGDIVASARAILSADLKADSDLALELHEWLVEYGKLRPLEIHHLMSRNKLETDVPRLQREVDEFVEARRLQVANWPDLERPGVRDAQAEVHRRAVQVGEGIRGLELPRKGRESLRELGEITAQSSRKTLSVLRRKSGQAEPPSEP